MSGEAEKMSDQNIKTGATAEQNLEGKYLSFILGDEEYAIEILTVREIISFIEITAIPNVPGYIKGVVNLRGKVIAVIDLRLKFGLPEKEYDKSTCTIVVSHKDRFIGIIVDTVSEVLEIRNEEIDPPPGFGTSMNTDFILGMGKVKDMVVILLDICKVLESEELKMTLSSTGKLKDMEAHGNV